jgi:hypothetical protein
LDEEDEEETVEHSAAPTTAGDETLPALDAHAQASDNKASEDDVDVNIGDNTDEHPSAQEEV